jgi:hypothetical protein
MRWIEVTRSERELAQVLTRCMEACRTSELHCTLAMDVAATMDDDAYGARGSSVLLACARLCDATASAIASLSAPNVESVADVLLACRVACRAASSECRRRSFDVCCTDCARACGDTAALCESLLAHTALAAA